MGGSRDRAKPGVWGRGSCRMGWESVPLVHRALMFVMKYLFITHPSPHWGSPQLLPCLAALRENKLAQTPLAMARPSRSMSSYPGQLWKILIIRKRWEGDFFGAPRDPRSPLCISVAAPVRGDVPAWQGQDVSQPLEMWSSIPEPPCSSQPAPAPSKTLHIPTSFPGSRKNAKRGP